MRKEHGFISQAKSETNFGKISLIFLKKRRFISLSTIWTVNDFKPIMTTNIFKTLRDRYQIPDNIPIRLLGKFEKCYSGKIANVGMYDIMFTIGLRLPLTTLHCQLATFLGLYVSQVAPNAWRIFIGTKIL